MINFKLQHPAFVALAAALLFGASTPFAKLLLGEMPVFILAGLLYLGSGAGLLLVIIARKYFSKNTRHTAEARLQGRDYLWLAGAVICGGVLAPVLLLSGLRGSSAATASLLLNLENVITILVAAVVFREAISRRIWLATLIMLLAGLLLFYSPGTTLEFSPALFAILGACSMWALDNNLTRAISATDPLTIVMIKGLVAGFISLGIGLILGGELPNAWPLLGALTLGLLSYGLSLVLFIYALRHLGSARTSAHFSTAPFIGAGIAILLLGEALTISLIIAFLLMLLATWLVLAEQHQHQHQHEPLNHAHRHRHDAHHQHEHDGGAGTTEQHSHAHHHAPLSHTHAHLPDLHHRHTH